MKVFRYSSMMMSGLIALIFLGSCDSGVKTTESGLEYEYVKKGEGPKADSGLVILMNVAYLDENDSLWFTTISGQPAPYNFPAQEEGMFNEAIRMCSEGDSLIMKIPASDFFLQTFKRPVPEGLSATSKLTFNLGIDKVLDRTAYSEYALEMQKKLQAEAAERAVVQLEVDKKIIREYLDENGIDAQETESGLFYVITEEGSGDTVMPGEEVSVNYTGRVLNGPYFDSSIEEVVTEQEINRPGPYEPIKFRMGVGAVIPGWDEGIALLNKGAKATLYIPSTLAYGERKRSEEIVENSILVFDIEVVDIIKEDQE